MSAQRRLPLLLAVGVLVAGCSSASSAAKRATRQTTTTPATVATPANLAVLTVDAAARQTIAGFGASGAWWPIDLAHFPESVQRDVSRMLFSPSGLALSGYRYNIGGGGRGVGQANRAPAQFAADHAGLTFLRMASDARVPALTAFVNSAPPRFTTNGKACGGQLKPGSEAAYGDYLASIVQTLHDRDHVTISFVSPMNEPDNAFGDCGQEGMQVPIAQRAVVVQALGKALARRAPWARVIADETTADALTSSEVPQWLATPGTVQYVAAIVHHTYDFPNDALRALLPPLSARFHRPTWMTEICCYKGSGGVASSFGAQYDPTMTQGLWLANQIFSDFTVAGDSAWYWWTALSPVLGCDPHADPACPTTVNTKGFNDGLLYYDEHGATDGTTTIFTTKRYSVLGQFSRYVRPGAVRHDVAGAPAGVHAMAFERRGSWTVVAWNESPTTATLGIRLPAGRARAGGAVATGPTEDLHTMSAPRRTAGGDWLAAVAPSSIATYTFAASR